MARIARILVEPDQAEELRTTDDVDRVLELLAPEPVPTTLEETS